MQIFNSIIPSRGNVEISRKDLTIFPPDFLPQKLVWNGDNKAKTFNDDATTLNENIRS